MQARIIADTTAPGTQQPTVLSTASGIPQVNIQTPSSAGVSRNTYSQFDVDSQGAILNNSRTATSTQIGGYVAGNPWLAGGSARIILNEVNSSDPSQLTGYVEVAGQRAEVVIANPSGIHVDGGGFINASRATLVTGTAQISDGSLTGYQVTGGQITINGGGLDASTTDYTDLISRSVAVNAGIWASDLRITTGANQVDAANTTATPIAGSGPAPILAIDVAQLGGMYAGKIKLVGTEAGVGVRNAGDIGASAGEVVVTADGHLENSGHISGTSNVNLNGNTGITNSGTVYSRTNTTLTTLGNINNSGTIAAQGDTSLAATGTNSSISSTSVSILAAGVKDDGTLGDSGNLTVSAAKTITARGLNAVGGNVVFQGQSVDISGSTTSGSNLAFYADAGDLDFSSTTLSASKNLTLSTSGTLRTDAAVLSANQFTVSAVNLSNVGGELLQTGSGDLSLIFSGNVDNTSGVIATNSSNFTLIAANLTNTGGTLQHAGSGTFSINTTTLSDVNGQILSNGVLVLNARTATLDGGITQAGQLNINVPGGRWTSSNYRTSITQAGQLNINVPALSNRDGQIAQFGEEQGTITTAAFDNSGGSLLSNGSLLVNAAEVNNQGGTIQSVDVLTGLNLTISGTLDNSDSGLIVANGPVRINAGIVNNTQGVIGSAEDNVTLNVSGGITNSNGQIEAACHLSLSSLGLINTDGVLFGATASIDTRNAPMDNTGGFVVSSSGMLSLSTGILANDSGLIQSRGQLTIDTHGQKLSNTSSGTSAGIIAQAEGAGSLNLSSGELDNTAGFIGGNGAMTISGSTLINTGGGLIVGNDELNLNGVSLNNQGGQIQALGNIGLGLSGSLTNTGGLIGSGETLSIQAGTIVNSNTSGDGLGLQGNNVTLSASSLSNTNGFILADEDILFTGSGSLDNSSGLMSAGGNLSVRDEAADRSLTVTNTGGTLISGGQLEVLATTLSGGGSLLSLGNIILDLLGDYLHTGTLQANGDISLHTAGGIVNQSLMQAAGTLSLNAATLDNQASGEISSTTTQIDVAGALTNRGLIDGSDTFLAAGSLTNIGTGRIYGDHVAIATSSLWNGEEDGQAAVIAARWRLDIGASTITNREHALLLSLGDMAIGSGLDSDHLATGQASLLTNASATIQAGNNLAISASTVQNLNLHFSTAEVVVSSRDGLEKYQVPGDPTYYYAPDVSMALSPDGDGNTYVILVRPGLANAFTFTRYIYSETVTETQITETDPAQIIAGGNLSFFGTDLLNDKSRIIAGGTISLLDGAGVTNTDALGTRTTEESGEHGLYRLDADNCNTDIPENETGWWAYAIAPLVETFSLVSTVYQEYTATSGSGAIAARTTGTVTASAGGAGQVSGSTNSGLNVDGSIHVVDVSSGSVAYVGGNFTIPNVSLYQVNSDPSIHYLVETDPRFTNYSTWLSSDYMLSALSYDPDTVLKRLGDGYYEAQLIREQVAELTGRRFLDGYASDEAEYQALMDNGITFAAAYHLQPGVALTAEQMAQLTSDIVWLAEQTVTLVDGTTTRVLVPQVYLRVEDGDLSSTGALISGSNIKLNLSGDLVNSGTIAGRNIVVLTAENVQNLGGRITGTDVGMLVRTDLNNIGGTISAGNSLTLVAGHDINVTSETSTQSVSNMQLSTGLFPVETGYASSRTNVSRVAGLYVTGGTGDMIVSAGNNVNLTAAAIANTGSGSTYISAGHDLNMNTVRESFDASFIQDADHYHKEASYSDIGTTVETQGDLVLNAGHDMNLKAATVTTDARMLVAQAGNDINLTTGESYAYAKDADKYSHHGFGSTKTTVTIDTLAQTTALGSTLSGDLVLVDAGHDITVTGGNVVSSGGTALVAGHDINLLAATDTSYESHYKEVTTSGLLGTGGIGFTVGTRMDSVATDGTAVINSGSLVGSLYGDTTLMAGNHYQQTGSTVTSPQGDVNISAQSVDIEAAEDQYASNYEHEYKQSGLTVALSVPVAEAVKGVVATAKTVGQSKYGRVNALAIANTALGSYSTYKAGDSAYSAYTGSNTNSSTANTSSPDSSNQDSNKGTLVNISITVGEQQNHDESQSTGTQASPSEVNAGGQVNIVASGAGEASNINIIGSSVAGSAGTTLLADNAINLLAFKETSHEESSSTSYGWNVGVAVSVGKGSAAVGVTAGGNYGIGSGDGEGVTYGYTYVGRASSPTVLSSGGVTNIIGAQVLGESVQLDASALNIQSLQETSTYESSQMSASGQITVGYGFSGSGSFGMSSINADYASVMEQSGIYAGDGGYQIHVKGNTDLKGAIITSSSAAEEAGKNSLVTGTLTASDIENYSNYEGTAYGMDASGTVSGETLGQDKSSGLADQGNTSAAKNAGYGEDGDSQFSVTKSGINTANITITDAAGQQALTGKSVAQTIADIKTDVTTETAAANSGALANTFNASEVQKELDLQVSVTKEFDKNRQMVQSEINAKIDQLKAEDATGNKAEINELQTLSLALDTIAAGLSTPSTSLAGSLAAAASPALSQAIGSYFKSMADEQGGELTGAQEVAHVLAHGILAAAVASTGGNDALTAAVSAGGAEAAAPYLSDWLYGESDPEKLTAEQKSTISAITGLLSSTGTLVATGSATSAVTSGALAQNAVENNWLAPELAMEKSLLYVKESLGTCDEQCQTRIAELEALDAENNKKVIDCLSNLTADCSGVYEELRTAAADYSDKYYWRGQWSIIADPIYLAEKNETLRYADMTLTGGGTDDWWRGATQSWKDRLTGLWNTAEAILLVDADNKNNLYQSLTGDNSYDISDQQDVVEAHQRVDALGSALIDYRTYVDAALYGSGVFQSEQTRKAYAYAYLTGDDALYDYTSGYSVGSTAFNYALLATPYAVKYGGSYVAAGLEYVGDAAIFGDVSQWYGAATVSAEGSALSSVAGEVAVVEGGTVNIGAGVEGSATNSVDYILKPDGEYIGTVNPGATPNIRTVSSNEFNQIQNQLLEIGTSSGTYANGSGIWYDLPSGGRFGVRTSANSGVTLDIDIPGYPKGFKVHQK